MKTRVYAQYRKSKAEKEAAVKKKAPVPAAVVSVAAGTALDEMEGGSEIHDAYMAAYTLAKPATNAVDAGRNLYCSQVAKAKQDKLRKKQSGSRIKEKAVKESAVKKARKPHRRRQRKLQRKQGRKQQKKRQKLRQRRQQPRQEQEQAAYWSEPLRERLSGLKWISGT